MKHEILQNINIPPKCPHQKTDNLGYTNCTKNDSTIGYCKTPCPYETTSSATIQNCTTFVEERFSKRFGEKKLEICSVQVFFEVVQFFIEAEGDDYHA
jgi:hypothetical protein